MKGWSNVRGVCVLLNTLSVVKWIHVLSYVLSPQESIIDLTLNIPFRIHNSLIGPKGKLVRSVMDDCGGVRIQFPPSGSKKDEIKLHGPKEDVKKAEAMLLELAEEQVRRCVQVYSSLLELEQILNQDLEKVLFVNFTKKS